MICSGEWDLGMDRSTVVVGPKLLYVLWVPRDYHGDCDDGDHGCGHDCDGSEVLCTTWNSESNAETRKLAEGYLLTSQ